MNIAFNFKLATLALVALGLAACGSPEEHFNGTIEDQGYIPYNTPLAAAGVGTILKGAPEALRVAAKPQRCFPDSVLGMNTLLRWETETDLPDVYKKFTLGFGVDLSPLAAAGNPLLAFNAGFQYARNVQIEFEGATIEYLDEINFADFYERYMPDRCREYLESYPFITQALKIEKMKFTFVSKTGVNIALNADTIGEIVDIGAGVEWSIENHHTLVIETPKYIGYQVSALRAQDNGVIRYHAYRVKNNEFVFEEQGHSVKAMQLKLFGQALSRGKPARPNPSLKTGWGQPGSGEALH